MEIDTETLISLVEVRPELYNKQLKGYSDRNKKQKLWLDVCEAMVKDWGQLSQKEKTDQGTQIQKRWASARTSFKREYNLQTKTKSGQGSKKRKKYQFFDQLLFLIPMLDQRPTESDIPPVNIEHAQTQDSVSISDDNTCTPSTPSTSSTSTACDSLVQTNQLRARPSVPRVKKKADSYEQKLLSILEENCRRETEIDEDKNFLLSLIPSFKRLNNSKKIEVKMQFLRILGDIENERVQTTFYSERPQQLTYENVRYASSPVYENVTRYNQVTSVLPPPPSPANYSTLSQESNYDMNNKINPSSPQTYTGISGHSLSSQTLIQQNDNASGSSLDVQMTPPVESPDSEEYDILDLGT